MKDDVIQRQLFDAIMRGDAETAQTKARVLAQYAKNPTESLDDLYDAFSAAESLHAVGGYDEERFNASSNAARAALSVLTPSLTPSQTRFKARICIGPVSGGADATTTIVAAMFTAAGHEAVDLSRSATPKELLRNAEQNGAELLIVRFTPRTLDLLQEFNTEFEAGGFRNKFLPIAFDSGTNSSSLQSSPFAFSAREPLELLSKTTELVIRKQRSIRE